MSRDELEALLEQVRAATGPDRKIDAALHIEFFPDSDQAKIMTGFYKTKSWQLFHGKALVFETEWGGGGHVVLDVTASIDSALSLVEQVLPGWSIQLWMSEGYKHPGVIMGRSYPTNLRVAVEAHTLPLAILAALLSAKIAEETDV